MLGRLGIAISALLFGMALGGAGADDTPAACGKKSSCPAGHRAKQGGCSSCPAAGCCTKSGACCAKEHPCDADCPKSQPAVAAEPCCPPPMPMAAPYFVGPASVLPAPPVM